MSIYITSDWHFNHNKSFIYEKRGFKTIQEMNETIIKNHNSIVDPLDDVYVLGDCILVELASGAELMKRMNGLLHIVLGNHDTDARVEKYSTLPNVVEISHAQPLHYFKYHFFLTHYPCITSNFDYVKPLKQRTLNLCGHSHTIDPFSDWDKGLIYHCEIDAHNMKPILLDDIISQIEERYSIINGSLK